MDIAPCSKVALMGGSGCGKSTLFLCLLRLLEPRKGSIRINGVDTATLGLTVLRRSLGLVPQDPVLFAGTIRFNLDPFNEHSDERIWRALVAVQLENACTRMVMKDAGAGTPRDHPDLSQDTDIGRDEIKDQVLNMQIKAQGE